MVKSNKYFGAFFVLLLGVLMVTSCKKYADPAQIFEDAVTKPYAKQRKVMLISIDGGAGPEIEKIMPTNIAGLLEHSKYTWSGFADSRTNDGPSWVNILSGKNASSAGVIDSTFQLIIKEEDGKHDDVQAYSTFLQRLLEGGVTHTSVAVSPWTNLVEKGFNFAEQAIVAADDKAVKDTVLAKMALPKLGTVIVNFNSVNKAGINSAFSADDQEYRDAVVKVDGYVGEIMEALKKRANYDREDWLVIITSNHGGEGNSYGGASFSERKVFALYHNENIEKQEFSLPPLVNTVNITTKDQNAILPASEATEYDFGTTGEFTVMFKVMLKNKPGGASHTTLLSKSNNAYGNITGWNFMIEGASTGKYRVVIGDGSLLFVPGGASEPVNTWATLALKIYEEDGKRWARMYTNGIPSTTATDITGRNLSSPNELSIGSSKNSIGTASQIVNNLGIWNTALSDEYIAEFACQQEVISSDANYSNLIGYWPANEGSGNTFFNKSPLAIGKDLKFSGYSWSLLNSWECGEPDSKARMLLNSDIAPQIFYWMQIETSGNWKLDGTVWLDKYETEFIK